jgi:signal transduction histidine kinase
LWKRVRYTPEVEAARLMAWNNEEQRIFWLESPDSNTEHLVGLCLPLRTREQNFGVLEVYGLESLLESDMVEILESLTSQAASALENARLYEELSERERRLHELVVKILHAQEEERRRVAYDVHDGLAQVAAAAHQRLQTFARRYPPGTERSRSDLQRVLNLVRQTVYDARKIIANLRPTALDDLGLEAAVSAQVQQLQQEGYQVDYEEEIGSERLPSTVEVALFRVVQEALTNVRKHAQTQRVRIELRRREHKVHLKILDFGQGFEPTATSPASGPGERIGLAGMRERINMIGGKFEVVSRLGVGTSVTAEIPLLTSPQTARHLH